MSPTSYQAAPPRVMNIAERHSRVKSGHSRGLSSFEIRTVPNLAACRSLRTEPDWIWRILAVQGRTGKAMQNANPTPGASPPQSEPPASVSARQLAQPLGAESSPRHRARGRPFPSALRAFAEDKAWMIETLAIDPQVEDEATPWVITNCIVVHFRGSSLRAVWVSLVCANRSIPQKYVRRCY